MCCFVYKRTHSCVITVKEYPKKWDLRYTWKKQVKKKNNEEREDSRWNVFNFVLKMAAN